MRREAEPYHHDRILGLEGEVRVHIVEGLAHVEEVVGEPRGLGRIVYDSWVLY